jgi:hypothetical protein
VLPAASEAAEEVPRVPRLARSRPWLHPTSDRGGGLGSN